MAASASVRHRPDFPILLIAVLAATAATAWFGGKLADDRCLDAGGRVLVSGKDRVCELADGTRMPERPLLTTTGRVVGVGLWLGLIAGSYGGMRWYVRSGRGREQGPVKE